MTPVIAKSSLRDKLYEGPHTTHLPGQHRARHFARTQHKSCFLCFKKTPVAGLFAIKAYKKLARLRLFLHSVHLCPPLLPTACDLKGSKVLTCVPVPGCGGGSLQNSLTFYFIWSNLSSPVIPNQALSSSHPISLAKPSCPTALPSYPFAKSYNAHPG